MSNYYDMDTQRALQNLDVHIKGFKKWANSNGKRLEKLEQISDLNLSFRDFKFTVIRENRELNGYIEAKTDYVNSPYMASELIGNIDLQNFDFTEHLLNSRIKPGSYSHNKITRFLKRFIDGPMRIKGGKLGFGGLTSDEIPDNCIFSYYRQKKKTLYLWKGYKINEYTKKCFEMGKNPYVITPNDSRGKNPKNKVKCWCSISLLIKYNEMKDFLLKDGKITNLE